MSGVSHYVEVIKAHTNGKKCHKCEAPITKGSMYLHLERNRHVYCICGKCLVIFASLVLKDDPTHKGDAAAELI